MDPTWIVDSGLLETGGVVVVFTTRNSTAWWEPLPSPAMPTVQPSRTDVPSKGRIFARRLISSVVLWTVVLSAIFSSNRLVSDGVFLLIMVTLAVVGLAEFYGMVEKRGLPCFKRLGIAGGVVMMVSSFVYLSGLLGFKEAPSKAHDFSTSIVVVFVLGVCLRQLFNPGNVNGMAGVGMTLFGLMYVPWLLNFIQAINYFPRIDGHGPYYVLYFILVTKFSDTGAYAVGSLIGRHKMIPRVSPGKTWEGFGGALLFSAGASVAFAYWAGDRLPGMDLVHGVVLGVLLGASAVLGDLIESLFKRESGLKDSGHFFPGIGGILDLLDSILFNAPLMYLYLRHVLTH
ncbi:MAG: phosphatidate cytidylyltransferase [Limisphaerales bacterium]